MFAISGDDWFHLLAIGVGLVGLAIVGVRRLTKADEAGVKRRIEATGVAVVWVKRLDTQSEPDPFNRHASTTYYDVLVERDGVRRIDVWRDGTGGFFKDH